MESMERRITALQWRLGRRALRATGRYAVRRFVARARTRPLRSVTLLSAGGAVGMIAGWLAGRRSRTP